MTRYHLHTGQAITVDPESLALLEGKTWSLTKGGTVQHSYWDKAAGRSRTVTLSTLLMGAAERGHLWQHADGDRLNFRRDNLRQVQRGYHHPKTFGNMTPEQQQAMAATRRPRTGPAPRDNARPNATRFRGVHKAANKFRAMATVNGKQTYLGLFESKEDAARAYDAALIQQGLDAVNFPASERQ